MQIVEGVIKAMKQQIEKYGLELLQRYPDDLLVYDRSMLEQFITPGISIAWMVGNSHSHICPLGLHSAKNEEVTYHLNMSSDDRFFVIRFTNREEFQFKELDRKGYAALQNTRVPYQSTGSVTDYWLERGKERVGYVHLEPVGKLGSPAYDMQITPMASASEMDKRALQVWANHSAVAAAHTLFVRTNMIWMKPFREVQAA